MVKRRTRYWVWIKRVTHCRGFGIQSPADYAFVRYVINEHWPYYQYDEIGRDDDWLTRKLGRLYFRLANWLQPDVITSDGYRDYLQAGCHRAAFGEKGELVRLSLEGDYRSVFTSLCDHVRTGRLVLVVEGIWRDRPFWREIVADKRTGVTFDLYYCGIVMFDKKRVKQNYVINF